MKRITYLLITVFLLFGCAPSTESLTPVSTMAPSLISINTSISTVTTSPTSTTLTPTVTISVSSTPSLTPSATPPNFSSFLTASAIRGACWGAQDVHYEDVSPDGNWFAVICKPNDPSKFYGTMIVKLNSDIVWNVPFYETFGKNYGIGDGEMHVVHWSSDGNYVYIVPSFCCADSPQVIFFNYFQNTLALYRLDLQTGNLTTTLQPFGSVFSGYNVSFSPSSKYLAYVISNSIRDLHIYNLQTGETFTITVDEQYIASGNFSWSQDGNKAIFIAVKSGWEHYQSPIKDGVSYFLMDLKEHKSTRLFDKEDIYRVSWTQEGNIILHNASGENGLFYDIQRNTFTVMTPTPRP